MTYRIGKIFMIVLQTVVVCVEQVFYVPTYNTERDSFLVERRSLSDLVLGTSCAMILEGAGNLHLIKS